MLKTLWRGWLVVARTIGHVQSFIILSLVYFVVMAPFAVVVRLFSDPLDAKEADSWQRLPAGDESMASLNSMRLQSWKGTA
jgi:hypothetical protein